MIRLWSPLLAALIVASCASNPGPLPLPGSQLPSVSPSASDALQASPPRAVLKPIASGLGQPVDLLDLPGSGDLLIAEQGGRILLLRDPEGADPRPETVADLGPLLVVGGERGLLGIALHPGFSPLNPAGGDPTTGERRIYLNYTRAGDGASVIAVARLDPSGGTLRLRGEPLPLLVIPQPYANHNAGDLLFRDDGLLVIPTGDGGSGGDPEGRAQDPQSLLGKILLLDTARAELDAGVTGSANGSATVAPIIWMSGLRNPWRVAFDSRDGALWIADVGEGTTEEVTRLPAGPARDGANLGWRLIEGDRCYEQTACSEPLNYAAPIGVYRHDGGACSISGAAFGDDPDGVRWFLFADWCDGRIRAIRTDTPTPGGRVSDPLATVVTVAAGYPGLSALISDSRARIWALEHGDGRLLRLTLEAREQP